MSQYYFKAKNPSTMIYPTKINKEQEGQLLANISSLFSLVIGSTNDIAHGTMVDAIAQIRKAGLLRQAIKKACKDATERYQRYDTLNIENMNENGNDRRRLYIDFLDSVQDRLKEPLHQFRKAISRELYRQGIPNRVLKSYIITAYEMLNYAVELFDKFIDGCPKNSIVDWRRAFLPARIKPTLQAWEIATDIICKDCLNLNLNNVDECTKLFNAIEDELVSEQNIFKSTTEALDLNPEHRLRVDRGYVKELAAQRRKITLTPFQEEYLVDNYNTMPKDKLAQALGISTATLHKFAKELNVCADLNQDKTRGEAYVEYEVEPNN